MAVAISSLRPKTDDPATKTSAPAADAERRRGRVDSAIYFQFTQRTFARSIISRTRAYAIFGSVPWMKCWWPKPGIDRHHQNQVHIRRESPPARTRVSPG